MKSMYKVYAKRFMYEYLVSKMSTSHLLPLHHRVSFVKSRNDEENLLSNSSDEYRHEINGLEVYNFYKEILSTSEINETSENKSILAKNEITYSKATIFKEPKPSTSTDDSDIEIIESFSERDKRLFLKAAAENKLIQVVNYIKRGIDMETKDMFEWTALMCAAAAGAEDVVEYLVNAGAKLDHADKSGRTAIVLAKRNNFHNITEYLKSIRNEEESSDSEHIDEVHCQICNLNHRDPGHESTIVHIVNAKKKPTERFAYGISEWSPGYQLLKKSGWTESKGLGKTGEGKKYPIKTVLKRDRKGLGLDKKLVKRVTHFASYDPKAVENVPKQNRRSFFKELEAKQTHEKKQEIRFRRMLNDQLIV